MIDKIVKRFKRIADAHPQINGFGVGPRYDIQDDFGTQYPYLWIVTDVPHSIPYSETSKYRVIEYSFTLRIGDKVNNQENAWKSYGEWSNNGLDVTSDTFTILLDIVNAISEDSIGLFSDMSLTDDITVEPFFHEDNGDVNGVECEIILRTKITNPCESPLTDAWIQNI